MPSQIHSVSDIDSLLQSIQSGIQAANNVDSRTSDEKSGETPGNQQSKLGPAPDGQLLDATIVIVDDEPVNIKLIRKYLKEFGYLNTIGVTDSIQATSVISQERADLVILDLMMPDISGLDILEQMHEHPGLLHVPVLILTASNDRATRIRALELGATDFLTKPVDISELLPRVRTAIATKRHHDLLKDQAEKLEMAVRQRTAELHHSREEVIQCLARAADYRDNDTGKHVLRVGRYCALIAEQLGWSRDAVELMEHASWLHDVGKIGVPDRILLKEGKLTAEEFAEMKRHTEMGLSILTPTCDAYLAVLHKASPDARLETQRIESPILQLAATIAMTHHERWDGTGYPQRLSGTEIPLVGRIVAVADVFDALGSKRPYKEAYPAEKCFELLEQERGKHFDPEVLDAFLARRNDVLLTRSALEDSIDSSSF